MTVWLRQAANSPELMNASEPMNSLKSTSVQSDEVDFSQLLAHDPYGTKGYESQSYDAFAHEMSTPLANIGVDATHGLFLAGILFVIGLAGVIARRNFLFMLMSLEIMMNAAALAFVMVGNVWGGADGQVMFVFILTLAAAEAAIGLAILLQFYHRYRSLDITKASSMKG